MGNQCGPAFPNPTTNPDLETYGRHLPKPGRNPPQPLNHFRRMPSSVRRKLAAKEGGFKDANKQNRLLFLRPALTHPTTHVTTNTGFTASHSWRTLHATRNTGAKYTSHNRTSYRTCLGIPGTYPGSESMCLGTGHDDGPECEWPPGLGVGGLSSRPPAVPYG